MGRHSTSALCSRCKLFSKRFLVNRLFDSLQLLKMNKTAEILKWHEALLSEYNIASVHDNEMASSLDILPHSEVKGRFVIWLTCTCSCPTRDRWAALWFLSPRHSISYVWNTCSWPVLSTKICGNIIWMLQYFSSIIKSSGPVWLIFLAVGSLLKVWCF